MALFTHTEGQKGGVKGSWEREGVPLLKHIFTDLQTIEYNDW